MNSDVLLLMVLTVTSMVLTGAVHEWAHAFAATRLGDDTARREGRLTLNPAAHIDPFGSVLMPALGAMTGFLFGWAKPVPYNPVRFDRKVTMRQGELIVAAAGPLANVVLAVACAALIKLVSAAFGPEVWAAQPLLRAFGALLAVSIWLNVVLAVFNLLPVPPLDGHKVARALLGPSNGFVRFVEEYRLFAFLGVLLVGVNLLGTPIFLLLSGLLRAFGIVGEWQVIMPGF